MKFTNFLKNFFSVIRSVQRERATSIIEFELKELENIFALLLVGGFVGLPSPPVPIALELLPYIDREVSIMLARSDFSQDPLAGLMGILEVD